MGTCRVYGAPSKATLSSTLSKAHLVSFSLYLTSLTKAYFERFALKLILKIHGFLSEGRRILKRMELLWSAKCQQTPHHSLQTLFVLCTLHGLSQTKSKLIFTPYFHLSFSFSLLHNFFCSPWHSENHYVVWEHSNWKLKKFEQKTFSSKGSKTGNTVWGSITDVFLVWNRLILFLAWRSPVWGTQSAKNIWFSCAEKISLSAFRFYAGIISFTETETCNIGPEWVVVI